MKPIFKLPPQRKVSDYRSKSCTLSADRSHPKLFTAVFYMLDIQKFKINCSQIGSLMGNPMGNRPPTEPQIKKLFEILGKNYGELSEPMKHTAHEILTKQIYYDPKKPSKSILTEMVLTYAYFMYGKGKVPKGNESPLQLEKGSLAEPEAIKALSKADGIEYCKNEQLFENKWIKGVPDIIVADKDGEVSKIIEVKASYDLPSFILAMVTSEDQSNFYEVMGYMDLLKCKKAEIAHVLVDMPGKIVDFEQKRLLSRYKMLQVDEETASNRIATRLNDMEYSNIPDDLKIFRRPVTFNRFTMNAVKYKTKLAVKWMQQIHDIFTKKGINLSSLHDEGTQDDNI